MASKVTKPKAPKAPVDPVVAQQQAQQKALSGLFTAKGTGAADAFLNRFEQPGFLGRIDDYSNPASAGAQQRSDTLAKYQAGLGGYTSPEYQAQREQMMKGVDSNTATGLDQLAKAQARGKVYGAAGSAQQANLLTGAQNSKNDLEQQLMVQNINEQQKRLGEYNTVATQQRDEGRQAQEFNLGQQNAEKASQLSGYLGIAGLGQSANQQNKMNAIYQKGLSALR